MSANSKAVLSEKLFGWNKHADAPKEYVFYEMRLKTKLSLGKHSRTYLLSAASVLAKRGEVVTAIPDLTDQQLSQMQNRPLRDWRYRKEQNERKLAAYELVQSRIDDDFSSAIGDCESLFAIDSNARAFIKNASTGPGSGLEGSMTHEEQFRAILLKLQVEFKPSVNLDLFTTKREFETLSDANGLSYTDYLANHTRLYEECAGLGSKPTDDTCETSIMEHFHNPFFEAEKKKMIMDRAHCKKDVDRVYTWRTFLEECAIYCASNPKADAWGTTQKEIATPSVQGQIARYTSVSKGAESAKGKSSNVSGGGKPTYDSCYRCGLSGHKIWKCTSTQCSKCKVNIGASPQGLRHDNLDHDSRKCKGSSSMSSSSLKHFDPSSAKKKALETMVKVCQAKLVDKRKTSGEAESMPKKKKRKLLRANNGADLQPNPQIDQEGDEEEED
jgi:hypothetical protein